MDTPKILYVAAECKPYSKRGGVADVAGELPIALAKHGVPITIVTPKYATVSCRDLTKIREYTIQYEGREHQITLFKGELEDVPVLLVENAEYLSEGPYTHNDIPFRDDSKRFSFFSKAVLPLVQDFDIIHGNDWMTGYLFGMMISNGMEQARVLTVHNIGYQGNMYIPNIEGREITDLLTGHVGSRFRDLHTEWNSINPMRLALELAHMTNAVSPTYASEITRPEDQDRFFEGGKGLESVCQRLADEGRLIGILNGFNYKTEPTEQAFKDALVKKEKSRKALSVYFKENGFLLGFVGRAVEQKFRLLTEQIDGKSVMERILDIPGVNIGILATGLPEYERFIGNIGLTRFEGTLNYGGILNFPRRTNYAPFVAFDREMAVELSAASDVFLMPSLSEACGTTQLEAMGSATPPLVRWTGGLKDTVISYEQRDGTGFGFDGTNREAVLRNLIGIVVEASKLFSQNQDRFKEIQRNAFNSRFTWDSAAKKYVKMYEQALRMMIGKKDLL